MGKPKIRFKGFDNDWEHRKLNEITDVRDGTHDSPKYVQEGHPFITSKNVSNGFINYDDVQYVTDEDYEEINKRSKVDVHDILMGMIGTIGNLALIRKEPDFAIKNVALIKYTGDIEYKYLYQALQADCVTSQLSTGMDGGTQKFVSLKKIRELDIPFPEECEQKKIGAYFSNLDTLITLHQRKCEDTKKLKKYMLQKMFPQNGSKVPEIRFKGFTDDWEQRKVGDITKELSEYAKLNSGLPLLTSARTGLMYQSDYRGNSTTDNENTLFSIVPLNACTYRHMSDDSTFHINVNTLGKGLVSKEYPVFVENESDLRFVVQYINSSDSFTKFCTEQKKGGTRTRLYYKTLCEYKMLIPSLNEQHIIADYFDNLDYLITLHQRECSA